MTKIIYCAVCNTPGLVGKDVFPYHTPWSKTPNTWAHSKCGQTLLDPNPTPKAAQKKTAVDSEGDSDELHQLMKEYDDVPF